MRRVVITGMGIVSPLGDSVAAVLDALGQARSGIRFHEPYREMGLRAHIGGFTRVDVSAHIDKKNLRFMGNAAAYATIAMQQAIDDAGLGGDVFRAKSKATAEALVRMAWSLSTR